MIEKYNQNEWRKFLSQHYIELSHNLKNYKTIACSKILCSSMSCHGYDFWRDCEKVFYRMACIDINNFLSNDNKGLAILAYAKKYADESIKQSIENKIDSLVNGKYKEKIKIIRNKAIAHWDNNKLDNIEDFWSKEFDEIIDTIGNMLKVLDIETESKFNYGDINSIVKMVEKKLV